MATAPDAVESEYTGGYDYEPDPEEGKFIPGEIMRPESAVTTDQASATLDEAWAKKAFLVPGIDLAMIDAKNRYHSSALFGYTDTTPGGSYQVNPKPQFCQYADVPEPGRLPYRSKLAIDPPTDMGLGVYYHEVFNLNKQLIHFRFGVPQFNGMTVFFTGFYNVGLGRLVKTGRVGGISEIAYSAISIMTGILVFPLVVVSQIGRAAKWFLGMPTSKYCYLKPTMFPYIASANSIINKIAVNRGFIPASLTTDPPDENANVNTRNKLKRVGANMEIDRVDLKILHDQMPTIFSEDGGIDLFNFMGRTVRMRNWLDQVLEEREKSVGDDDVEGMLVKWATEPITLQDVPANKGMVERLQEWLGRPDVSPSDGSNGGDPAVNDLNELSADQKSSIMMEGMEKSIKETAKNDPIADSWYQAIKAEANDGTEFVTFEVDFTGPVNESFSSSFGESEISSKLNSMASSARNASYSMSGGDTGIGVVDSIVGFAKGAISSVAAGLQMSGLVALAGGSFVDIPKHWQQSVANLPRTNYKIALTSWSGDPVSQLINIWIPVAFLLAGTLPRSTGTQSYNAPYYCELWDKGRAVTRYGMIESLDITRGNGSMGWTDTGLALRVDVSFTVADMSSIVHMPFDASINPLSLDGEGLFDDETSYHDLISTYSGLGLEQIYRWNTFMRKLRNKRRKLDAITSPGMWAKFVHDYTPVGLADAFVRGTDRDVHTGTDGY